MISIIIFLIAFAIIGKAFGAFNPENYRTSYGEPPRQAIKTGVSLLIAGLIAVFQPIEIHRIDAGNVGLKIDRIGNDKGIPVARPCKGWVFYNSWLTDIAEYSIRQNHVSYKAISVTTKGGFPMTMEPSYNYALKPEKAADLYVHLLKGSDFSTLEENFLATATNLALNNATNKYAIDSIFNDKEGFNKSVAIELNKELQAYFTVTQINPGSVAPKELVQVIIDKTNAVQKQQQAELDKLTAEAEAQTKIAVAEGTAKAAVIEAEGEAEAIRKKQVALSPTYVEYIKWNKWDGVLPTTSLGGNTSVLLNTSK